MHINTPDTPYTYAYDDRVAHSSTFNTGENSVGAISVVPPSAVEARCAAYPRVQDIPDELLLNSFSRLSCSEKVVKSTFESANRGVNDISNTESKRWFSHFSPQQQAKFKKIADGTDEQVVRTWLGQFTKEEKEVKHLIDNRHHPQYPEFLFYTVSVLMAECQAFKVEQVASIEHTQTVFATTFSVDGNHMVTQGIEGQCKICSLSPGGNWVENTTINVDTLTPWARFSGDGKHVIIGSGGRRPAKIYALNSDGNWVVANHLPQASDIKYLEFSPDGLHAAIIDKTNTLRIFGQGMDGAWAEEKTDEISYRNYLAMPIFNRDSNELLALSTNEELLIYRRGSDGRWKEKAILSSIQANSSVFQASPLDSHMVTQPIVEKNTQIFGCGTDGDWMEQAGIDHKGSSADFSPNSRYLVIHCYAEVDTAGGIYFLDMNENWIEMATINQTSMLDSGMDKDRIHSAWSADFSPNSRVLVINSTKTAAIYYLDINGRWIENDSIGNTSSPSKAAISFDGRSLVFPQGDTVKLYSLGPRGVCDEETRIDRATQALFSTDSNHIFTYHEQDPDGNVRIYGLSPYGKLKLKATFAHGQPIWSATISPTGRYLVTNGYDHQAKIWKLCSSAENEPGARKAVRE